MSEITEEQLAFKDHVRAIPEEAYDFSDIPIPQGLGSATLEAVLGLHEELEGHADWYGRAPKLRERREIAKLLQSLPEDDALASDQIDSMVAVASLVLYRIQDGQFRRATFGEVLDEFDELDELLGLARKFKVLPEEDEAAEKKGDPQTETPTGEPS